MTAVSGADLVPSARETSMGHDAPAARRRVLGAVAAVHAGQGIPLVFIATALPVLLRQGQASLDLIGAISAVMALPYALAFLWAPMVDRRPFGPLAGLGLRRSWIVTTGVLGCGTLALLSVIGGVGAGSLGLATVVGLAVIAKSVLATQKTAVLGYTADALDGPDRPAGSAVQGTAGAVGGLVGGAVLVPTLDRFGWSPAVLLATAIPVALLWFVIRAPEPDRPEALPAGLAGARPSLRRALADRGWADLARLAGVLVPLVLAQSLAYVLVMPRLVDLGIGLSDIGVLAGVAGLLGWIVAGPLGTLAMARLGHARAFRAALASLVVLYCAVAGLAFLAPDSRAAAVFGIAGFYVCFGLVHVGVTALFMTLSAGRPQAATDFSLLSCLYFGVAIVGFAAGGSLGAWLGYAGAFAVTALLAGVALLGSAWLPSGPGPHG